MQKSSFFLVWLLVVIFSSGCARVSQKGESFVGVLPTDAAVSAIAHDVGNFIATQYPPGHTSIVVVTPKKATDRFSTLFDGVLRAQGFTILPYESPEAVRISYILDKVNGAEKNDPAYWFLQAKIKKGTTARAYTTVYSAFGVPGTAKTSIALETTSFGAREKQTANHGNAGVTTRFSE